jgi:deoxyribodipyrimidine photolyase-related protein
MSNLVLVLGDQLTPGHGALRGARPGEDTLLLAEVVEEARYVRHNKHKIALIFAAMRHFRDEMRAHGFEVIYLDYAQGTPSLLVAVEEGLRRSGATRLRCCQPGEYRLHQGMSQWRLPVPVDMVEDDRFLAGREEFAAWAEGRKQLRMEYFYREMRRKHDILLDSAGKPEGGKWNYDASNRQGWRAREAIPARPQPAIDPITTEVLELVNREFPDHPGDLEKFYTCVTSAGAEQQFEWFLAHGLPRFGQYQDALAEESPWLFHSLLSMYLNIGLLDPLQVCQRVEQAWRDGACELAAAEGFIRQVIGWREYVRGIYWAYMPEYGERDSLDTRRPLPAWFWNGNTDLRCLHIALHQSLELGYAHHIQRLMVIGNFALLAGLEVEAVCAWYLAVYVDAFEWVELPNTLGMALYGDDGLMASKPYAASGKYIQRQGNHCGQCRYDPKQVTGDGACPYNALYWHFLEQHAADFAGNARMSLVMKNWEVREPAEKTAILHWAGRELERLAPSRQAR